MELAMITALLIKHVIADYFMQFSWMIRDKGNYGAWRGLAHSEFHGFLTWLVLWYLGVPFIWAVVMGVLDTVIHYHVDYVKSNFWKSRKLGPSDQLYWVTHGVDQLLHFMTYILVVFLCR